MANERLSRRYAMAVFSLAQEANVLETVGAELHSVASLLDENVEFRHFFRSPMIHRETKIATLTAAFEGKIQTITLHTLLLLIQKRREMFLSEIATVYESLLRAANAREALTIASARPLGSNELDTLVERLSSIYKKTFDVRQELDPRLIGGLRVQMGDRRIDGSVSGRLEDLAATLFSQS